MAAGRAAAAGWVAPRAAAAAACRAVPAASERPGVPAGAARPLCTHSRRQWGSAAAGNRRAPCANRSRPRQQCHALGDVAHPTKWGSDSGMLLVASSDVRSITALRDRPSARPVSYAAAALLSCRPIAVPSCRPAVLLSYHPVSRRPAVLLILPSSRSPSRPQCPVDRFIRPSAAVLVLARR